MFRSVVRSFYNPKASVPNIFVTTEHLTNLSTNDIFDMFEVQIVEGINFPTIFWLFRRQVKVCKFPIVSVKGLIGRHAVINDVELVDSLHIAGRH